MLNYTHKSRMQLYLYMENIIKTKLVNIYIYIYIYIYICIFIYVYIYFDMHSSILDIKIDYSFILSDYHPLVFIINQNTIPS